MVTPTLTSTSDDTEEAPSRPRRRRHRRKQQHCIPSERVLGSLGMVLGMLLLITCSVLVHLLLFKKLSSSKQSSLNSNYLGQLLSASSTRTTTNTTSSVSWNPELKFLHKKYRRPQQEAPPIFVVGLPKAGTSSLFAYFDCLGFYSQHWYCCGPQHDAQQEGVAYVADCMVSNLQDQLPILDGCGDYDVYTELNGPRRKTKMDQDYVGADGSMGYRPRIFLPQRYHLQQLHEYAPTATWILNVRPLEDWVHSVSQVPAKMLTKQLLFEAQAQDPARWAKLPNDWSLHPYRPTKGFLKEFWEDHIQYVTNFVAAHPSHSLIWVNISNPNAGIQLAQDLVAAGMTNVPVLQDRKHNHHQGGSNLKKASPENNDGISNRLYSRADACWGAHNVKQHGG
jgi:hypothetical protein